MTAGVLCNRHALIAAAIALVGLHLHFTAAIFPEMPLVEFCSFAFSNIENTPTLAQHCDGRRPGCRRGSV